MCDPCVLKVVKSMMRMMMRMMIQMVPEEGDNAIDQGAMAANDLDSAIPAMFDMMCAKDLDDNYCMADPANAQMFDSGDSGGENIANRRKVVDIKKKWRKGAAAGKTNTPRHYLAARRGSRRNGGPPPFASVDSDGDGCISQTEAEVIGFDSGDFAPVAGDSGSPCGDRVSPEEYAAANAGNDDDSSDDDHDGNNNNGDPPLHVMCSVCGMKMMQAITMFEDEEAPSSAQMKSMCYKKNNTYCGDYITGVKGNVPWDHMTRDCGAPEDPWTRPLPPGTWCSATCKTTITAMNSSWGCCAMTLAIAHDVEFSEYLRRQASSCGVSFVQPCQGGILSNSRSKSQISNVIGSQSQPIGPNLLLSWRLILLHTSEFSNRESLSRSPA